MGKLGPSDGNPGKMGQTGATVVAPACISTGPSPMCLPASKREIRRKRRTSTAPMSPLRLLRGVIALATLHLLQHQAIELHALPPPQSVQWAAELVVFL